MTERDLAYWLQGLFELAAPQHITEEQIEIMKRHVDLVEHDTRATFFTAQVRSALKEKNYTSLLHTVHNYFQHVIDPLDPDPQASQAVHDGLPKPPRPHVDHHGQVLFRC